MNSLEALRAAGWTVAVVYRLDGERFSFWLFTHSSGLWAKGEGSTDAEAWDQAWTQAQERLAIVQTCPDETCPDEASSLEAIELWHIERVLDSVCGHRKRAAEILGIGEHTIYRKLKDIPRYATPGAGHIQRSARTALEREQQRDARRARGEGREVASEQETLRGGST